MKKRLKDKLQRKKRLNSPGEAGNSSASPSSSPDFAQKLRTMFDNMTKDMNDVIDECEDKEFIDRGKESMPYQFVEKMVEARDTYFSRMHAFPPEVKPYAMLHDFNRALEAAWRKLEEKWKRAEQAFPELAEELRDTWSEIRIVNGESPYMDEMKRIKQTLAEAIALRTAMSEKYEESSLDEASRAMLAKLDSTIELGKRDLSKVTAKAYRQLLVDIEIELNKNIEAATDDELIASIYETAAARHLREYALLFGKTTEALADVHPDEKPQEILNLIERTIAENRRKLRAKREAAEKRHPHLKKEYPMDDEYKKALAELVEAFKIRDEIREDIKIVPPEKRSECLRMLQDLDKRIDREEQALAARYEAVQAYGRALDNIRYDIKLATRREIESIREQLENDPAPNQEIRQILAEEFPDSV